MFSNVVIVYRALKGVDDQDMRRFFKKLKKRIRAILFEDTSSHALYDSHGYIRP